MAERSATALHCIVHCGQTKWYKKLVCITPNNKIKMQTTNPENFYLTGKTATTQQTRNSKPATLPPQLATGNTLIEVDPRYFRPTEVDLLIGDPAKAREKLGWKPKEVIQSAICNLQSEIDHSDIKLFQKDLDLKEAGHKVLRQAE